MKPQASIFFLIFDQKLQQFCKELKLTWQDYASTKLETIFFTSFVKKDSEDWKVQEPGRDQEPFTLISNIYSKESGWNLSGWTAQQVEVGVLTTITGSQADAPKNEAPAFEELHDMLQLDGVSECFDTFDIQSLPWLQRGVWILLCINWK